MYSFVVKVYVVMWSLLLLTFFVCGHLGHGDIPGPLTINFLSKKWYRGGSPIKFVNIDEPLVISCQTTSPYAKVRLLKGDNTKRRWLDAVYYSNGEVTKIGQTFLIQKLGLKNTGYYKCVAANWNGDRRELEKGRLIVNPVQRKITPEIFPNVPVLRVKPNDDVTITCQTVGARGRYNSFITWYRRKNDGTLSKVDEGSTVRSGKVVAGNSIDIEKIRFPRFTVKDAGTYVCVRKVYGANPTQKDIRLVVKRAVSSYDNDVPKPLLQFITKKWNLKDRVPIKVAMLRQFVFISCQTNDPDASITLLRRHDKSSPWKRVNNKAYGDDHVIQIGQAVMVTGLTLRDTAYYKCQAIRNHGEIIELEKGFLVVGTVRKDHKPEIFPRSSILRVRMYDAITVTCKAIGVIGNSFLTWYRKYNNNYIYVNSEYVQRTKEVVGGNHVDVEKLVIREFKDNDVGEYVCVRKVADSEPTIASIRIWLDRNS